MIILSDCLTNKIDEGCLKVANSFAKRVKNLSPETTIISYERKPDYSDVHLSLNKLFLNLKLLSLIHKRKEPVLYIPFASNTLASCIRICILSLFSKRRVSALFALRFSMNPLSKMLLKLSGAKVIALSKRSFDFYKQIVGHKAIYIKTGVDTEKFVPVDESRKTELREKYNIPSDKKVLLHVGHLKSGRNVDKLLYADEKYHIVLVVSSVTESQRDMTLYQKLLQRKNTTIIDTYLEDVQEVYQMSDVYLFPVQEEENCIDVPLSVLEAASCNIPIVTTEYGELEAFKENDGFLFIENLNREELNAALNCMVEKNVDNRSVIKAYDWKESVEKIYKVL